METHGLPQHTAAMQPNTTSARTLKVFLVEDSPPIQERLLALLAAVPGVSIVGHADKADDAITQIVDQQPDAVVLDLFLNLAKGSGLDVLRALKDRAPLIAVYVLTNFANAQYRRLCTSLGARGFFDKSTEFVKVRDAIAARALQHIH